LDVSVKETSICIVDDTGRIVREAKVASEPEALLQFAHLFLVRLVPVGRFEAPRTARLVTAMASCKACTCFSS
jgi:hypothetical protein